MPRSFEELFAGGPDYNLWSPGEWNPAGKLLPAIPPEPVKGEVLPAHWSEHFDGKRALIVSPTLMPSREALFGVIDVDPTRKADRGPKVAEELFELLHSKELPFAVCESKSNGAHAYIFFDAPEQVREVNKLLAHIVEKLDIKGRFKANIDLRPSPATDGGGTQIQLPYFGREAIPGASSPRAMKVDGRYLTREEFTDWCNTHAIVDFPTFKKQVIAQLGQIASKHTIINNIASYEDKAKEGPVCYETWLVDEEPGESHEGHRDDLLCHIAARLSMMFPEAWKDMLHDVNLKWSDPLPSKDVDRIIRQQERTSFGLFCERDFAAAHCQREICKTRRFGVMAKNTVQAVVGAEIKKIIKFKPPEGDDQNRYPVHIYLEGQDGYINTNQDALTNFMRYAADVFHRYKFHVPHMKQPAYHAYINAMLGREGDVFFEEPMPREMTLQGRFERLAKAYFAERLHRPNMPIERESFSRAGTVVWEEDKKALVLDGGVFVDEMRRRLKEVGVTQTRIMDMFAESTLLKPGTRVWKATYAKHGFFGPLTWFCPRYEGDGVSYPDDERDTIWFKPPEEEAY